MVDLLECTLYRLIDENTKYFAIKDLKFDWIIPSGDIQIIYIFDLG